MVSLASQFLSESDEFCLPRYAGPLKEARQSARYRKLESILRRLRILDRELRKIERLSKGPQ